MLAPMKLPPRQRCILEYFADAEDHGKQASRAEAAKDLGYAFPSAVSKHIEALARKGLVIADRIKKRNVRLTEEGWTALGRTPAQRGVPIIGAIAAGAPILAVEHHDDYLQDVIPVPGRFALRVRGDSMVEAGILDGDFAIVQHGEPVGDGQIGAVVVDDEATLKRVRYRKHAVRLEPANRRYKPLVVDRKDVGRELEIVGPLRFIYRQVT